MCKELVEMHGGTVNGRKRRPRTGCDVHDPAATAEGRYRFSREAAACRCELAADTDRR
ncbi:MAG: hypothetical protein ACREUC_05130 [Steroidobacteraceae bacterium]